MIQTISTKTKEGTHQAEELEHELQMYFKLQSMRAEKQQLANLNQEQLNLKRLVRTTVMKSEVRPRKKHSESILLSQARNNVWYQWMNYTGHAEKKEDYVIYYEH